MRFHKQKYNPLIQAAEMRSRYPQFAREGRDGIYTFRGGLRPRPESVEYQVLVKYCLLKKPGVWITSPTIVPDAPHRYPSDLSLCLYYPDDFIWRKDTSLARYILPWTAAWLYFYEQWLETGVWLGPEAPHNVIENKPSLGT